MWYNDFTSIVMLLTLTPHCGSLQEGVELFYVDNFRSCLDFRLLALAFLCALTYSSSSYRSRVALVITPLQALQVRCISGRLRISDGAKSANGLNCLQTTQGEPSSTHLPSNIAITCYPLIIAWPPLG